MYMSRRLRGAGAIVITGLFGGLALGSFASGRMHGPTGPLLFADLVGNPNAANPTELLASGDLDYLNGPPMDQIVCTGCGPGIAERMSTQYAFDYDDRLVRNYLNYIPLPPLTTTQLEADVRETGPRPMLALPPVAEPIREVPQPAIEPVLVGEVVATGGAEQPG